MSVRLRGKRHEASDTTSFDGIYFPPGSIGFWRETLIPGGEECGPFREPAGWAVFLVARGSEVQLSYPCTGSERCASAVPLVLTGVLLWIVLLPLQRRKNRNPANERQGNRQPRLRPHQHLTIIPAATKRQALKSHPSKRNTTIGGPSL